MKSETLGRDTLEIEVTQISGHGIWLLLQGKEYFLSFDNFPWFKDASISAIQNVELLNEHHLYWPDLDIDLSVKSIKEPKEFPLIAKRVKRNPSTMSVIIKKPDWFLLLRAWLEEDHGERGLTLPFLIGALAFGSSNAPPTIKDARALLNEMITKPVDDYVVEIARCPSLGAPILTAKQAPSQFQPKVGFRGPGEKEMSVVFGLDLQTRWNSSDAQELLNSLLDECELAILDRTYSRDPYSKTYKAFEPWEQQFIDRILRVGDQ